MSTKDTTITLDGCDDAWVIARARALPMMTFIANRLATGASGPIREVIDLSVTEGRLLWLIGVSEVNTAADAVRSLGIDKAAISRSVKRLIDEGLVLSKPDERHMARNLLALTDKGQRYAMALERFTAEREKRLLSVLTPAERTSFLAALAMVLTNIEAANSVRSDQLALEE